MRELILGGARSGKSALAEARASASERRVCYIATAEAGDEEMAERIAAHRRRRPADWETVEAAHGLVEALTAADRADRLLLVDCLTLWLANRLGEGEGVEAPWTGLVDALPGLAGDIVLVSNEVGFGIVPDNAVARRFRDTAGRMNQAVAAECERVTLVAAGCPLPAAPQEPLAVMGGAGTPGRGAV